MKKDIVSHGMFIFLSLIFCAIQSNFYFLFFPIPQIWFIIPNYYSLTKSLSFSIACNFFISLVVVQFSVAPFYSILSSTNLITLMLYLFRTRFHMEFWHMSLSGGVGVVVFFISSWGLNTLSQGYYHPHIWSWLNSGLTTGLTAFLVLPFLSFLDEQIYKEKIDTLGNLRL